ncbi:hypothetical protein NLG97_g5871 [Lecanicillium saksenae]|uniref:Uncharacterized protein n=1 Tax=Lecanicillium saksenae TaxID=468837 RepID=A0ACC1QTL5_9HYPO|nr:hypothetical protein NLG97_g5871 [Lecanicillium saksenae]
MATHDNISIWSCENGPSETVSVERLRYAVQCFFGVPCKLVKLAQGGYHKVYEVRAIEDKFHQENAVDAVDRVAFPAFPGDKMKSEIATLKYIASHTSISVPEVLAWSSEASNPVGYLADLFSLRFEKTGSLYCPLLPSESLSPHPSNTLDDIVFEVGSVVSGPFYRMASHAIDYPTTDLPAHLNSSPSSLSAKGLHPLRGPFNTSSDYLAHYLRATLFKITKFPNETIEDIYLLDGTVDATAEPAREENEKTMHNAMRTIEKAIQLCYVYPGDAPVHSV